MKIFLKSSMIPGIRRLYSLMVILWSDIRIGLQGVFSLSFHLLPSLRSFYKVKGESVMSELNK